MQKSGPRGRGRSPRDKYYTRVQSYAKGAPVNLDARVLRAMFKRTSCQKAVGRQAIAERAGASVAAIDASLDRLRAAGLAETREIGSPRLTLEGLAIAVAIGAVRPGARRAPNPVSRAA